MLPTRILTAIILIPLVLCGIIYLPPFYFSLIVAALILVGAWEWAGLIGFKKIIFKILYVVLVGIGIGVVLKNALTLTHEFPTEASLIYILTPLVAAIFIWIWFFIAIISYQKNGLGAGFQFSIVRFFSGFIVLIATWIAIVALKALDAKALILVFFIIWAADVGGYFAGRFFGKKSLCSRVSPKKTWEGFFGGMILSVVVAAIGGLFLSLPSQHYLFLLLLALITALFSVVGDLGVSLLKRILGVKDSGKFFPGHGGMLDRLDSIMSATVVFVVVTVGMAILFA